MSQLGKVASIHLFQTVWHAGLLKGNRRWFRVKDWASRVTWVRVARSIFAYRCGFLMCNRAKLWTHRGGGRWLEQKLPNCEAHSYPAGKELWSHLASSSFGLSQHEPSGCLSSVAYDTPCFMWRTKTRVKTEDIYLNVHFTRGFLLNLNVKGTLVVSFSNNFQKMTKLPLTRLTQRALWHQRKIINNPVCDPLGELEYYI